MVIFNKCFSIKKNECATEKIHVCRLNSVIFSIIKKLRRKKTCKSNRALNKNKIDESNVHIDRMNEVCCSLENQFYVNRDHFVLKQRKKNNFFKCKSRF